MKSREALHMACRNKHLQLIELLIDRGADVNIPDNDKWTPLYTACYFENIEIIKLLLDYGADIHMEINHGCTSLDTIFKLDNLDNLQIIPLLQESSD